jgi:prepilin-type N-terminal cleavage/methylation domain-containing protein
MKKTCAKVNIKKDESGFTLMEVLIALVVLGIGFSILIEGFIGINNNLIQIKNYNYLINWSQTKLNQLVTETVIQQSGNFKYQNQQYQWWVEETYLDQYLKKINLNIKWNKNNKYSISTITFRKN